VTHHPRLTWLAAALGFGAAAIFLLSTRHGIGVWPDSVGYMQIGVIRHFSPLYTWLLKGASATGIDMAAGAKLLGLVFIVANSVLVFAIAFLATGRSWLAFGATLFIVISPLFVILHTAAMTEPLFLLLVLTAALLYVFAVERKSRTLFALAGGVIGASMLARFPGAAALGALCLTGLFQLERRRADRLLDSLAAGVCGSAVFLSWAVFSQLTTGQSTGRAFAFHGNADLERWRSGLKTLANAILPGGAPFILAIAVVVALALAALIIGLAFLRQQAGLSRAPTTLRARALALFFGCFSLLYAALVIVSLQIEANLPINGR
jgi:4-amino-4-deoxy-L-arabinose transferase-like glycosyltransferase